MTEEKIAKEAIKIYGEQRVDWQKELHQITIWFPEETVTNEDRESTVVYDIYARVYLKASATTPDVELFNSEVNNGLSFTRATFQMTHINNQYMHSHLPSMTQIEWKTPCLGKSLLKTLTEKVHLNENDWKLLLLEIQDFVRTESLSGIPYRRLADNVPCNSEFKVWYDDVATISLTPEVDRSEVYMKKFFKWYLEDTKTLGKREFFTYGFGWNGTCFVPMAQFKDILLDISNDFIKYYNEDKSKDKPTIDLLFGHRMILQGRLFSTYYIGKENTKYGRYEKFNNKYVLTFKGKRIMSKVIDDLKEENKNMMVFVNPQVVKRFINVITFLINYLNSDNGSKFASQSYYWKTRGAVGKKPQFRLL